MQVRLILDYATFNFEPNVYLDTISSTLAGEIDLKWHQKGMSENSIYISPFVGSFLSNSGFSNRPHRLQVSGTGCDHFEATLPLLRSLGENHLSRCDFAFDVIVSREDWKQYICMVFNKSLLEQDRQIKKYCVTGSGEAMTVYIGSRKCAKFCRIYNKSLEDKEYIFYDENGKEKELKRDKDGILEEYIIRYEIEFKRFKSKVQDFDPTFLFDSYYNDQTILIEFVCNVWSEYATDWLLPCPIAELQFVCKYDKQKFCTKESALQHINNTMFDAPRVFDSTVEYIADRFGKYIPFVLLNPFLRNLVIQKCENWIGLHIDLTVSTSESAFYDLVNEETSASDYNPWSDVEEYIQIPIESEVKRDDRADSR